VFKEAVLALLGLFEFEDGHVWKCYDFDVLDTLHAKGYITNTRSHNEPVFLTEQGLVVAKRLALQRLA
jgi:hypothetical protein